jgi:pyridoxal/pyridoxine/pyridoxamine kinase
MSEYQIDTAFPKVLSIQSTVVYGYVGNKASVYGLHARKIEVDPLMTCQFSNHTGYDSWAGLKVSGQTLHETVDQMRINGVLPQYSHILTGYIAEDSFIQELPKVIQLVKTAKRTFCGEEIGIQNDETNDGTNDETNDKTDAKKKVSVVQEDSRVLYLCDPVLGDNDHIYVPASFISTYRDELVPLADIVTPNETELRFLTQKGNHDKQHNDNRCQNLGESSSDNHDKTFTSINDVQRACVELHNKGPGLVVVTSMNDYPYNINVEENSGGKVETIEQNLKGFSIQVPIYSDEYYIRKSIGYPITENVPLIYSQHDITTDPFLTVHNNLDYSTPKCLFDAVLKGLEPEKAIGCLISIDKNNFKQNSKKCPNDVQNGQQHDNGGSPNLEQYYIKLPKFLGYIVGTGDLTASLILSHLQQIDLTDYHNHDEQKVDPNGHNIDSNCSVNNSIVTAICRALSTIHLVVRATIIRGLVGKHCTTCTECLMAQTLNPHGKLFPQMNEKNNNNNETNEKVEKSLQRGKIRANLVTEPLELWLTGVHNEFTRPSCKFTPITL